MYECACRLCAYNRGVPTPTHPRAFQQMAREFSAAYRRRLIADKESALRRLMSA
jgi:hypothetical protein